MSCHAERKLSLRTTGVAMVLLAGQGETALLGRGRARQRHHSEMAARASMGVHAAGQRAELSVAEELRRRYSLETIFTEKSWARAATSVFPHRLMTKLASSRISY